MEEAKPFEVGAIVEIIPTRQHAYPAKFRGRRAVVLNCFIQMGGRNHTARVQWLHKRTGKPLDNIDYFPAVALSAAPTPTSKGGE